MVDETVKVSLISSRRFIKLLCQEQTMKEKREFCNYSAYYSAVKLNVTKSIRLTNENRSFIQHYARGTAAPFVTIRR